MTSPQTGLKAYLKTIPHITSVIGTGDAARIYANRARQNATLPFLVITAFSSYSAECLDGIGGLQETRFQIDAYGIDEAEAWDLQERVRLAPLQGFRGDMGGVGVHGVTSPDSPRTGVETPQDGSDTARWWVSRDYFVATQEAKVYV